MSIKKRFEYQRTVVEQRLRDVHSTDDRRQARAMALAARMGGSAAIVAGGGGALTVSSIANGNPITAIVGVAIAYVGVRIVLWVWGIVR